MSARPGTLSPSRVSLVVFVAGMVVLLAALLAYEAHDAAQSQRRTAERALREYTSMAAAAFHDRFREGWRAEARRALGAATTGLAVSPFDPLVSLAVLRQSAAEVLPCAAGRPDVGRRILRLDLRSGVVDIDPVTVPSVERDRLATLARQVAQRPPAADEPYAITRVDNAPAAPFLIVGVRFVRLGAPIGVYAFTVCQSALGTELAGRVFSEAPLLPPSMAGAADNASVIALDLSDRHGAVARWGTGERSPYASSASLDDAGYTATVTLRASAVGNVSVGSLDGSRVPLLIGLLALTSLLGAVALVQLRREHELAQMRADFTSSVSHELRTPLTQIMLYGETLLLDRARTTDDRRMAAETIVREAGRLMQMVENVLAFGRLQRTTPATQLVSVPVDAVISEAVGMLQPLAVAAGVQVVVRSDVSLSASGDPAMLRQVLLNLLDNAIKYGAAGRDVRVRASPADGHVRIEVSDGGSGIPSGERERVWLPYVRLTEAQGRGGTGLGLAVVRELVTLMRGRVWVEDDPATGGARFVVELDAAPAPAATDAELVGR